MEKINKELRNMVDLSNSEASYEQIQENTNYSENWEKIVKHEFEKRRRKWKKNNYSRSVSHLYRTDVELESKSIVNKSGVLESTIRN